MSPTFEVLFKVANLLVLPVWLLMILAPRWRFTRRLVQSPLVVLPPIAVYAAVVLPALLQILPVVARPELPAVATLLGQARGTVAAWAHFLAFDLFVARWIFLDAAARREQESVDPHAVPAGRSLHAVAQSLILVLTLLLGPLGLVAYLAVRGALGARLRHGFRRLQGGHRALAWVTVTSLGLLVFTLLAQLFDSRLLTGVSVWVKPAKFAASVALAAGTMALLLPLFPSAGRGARRAMTAASWLFALELVIITVQAARGVPSHFNAATPIDGALFTLMGIAVTVIWLTFAYLTRTAFRQRFASPAQGWGIRLGLVAMLVGGAVGAIMPRPTAAQLESLRSHRSTPLLGAHAVGVADGGAGLPITGWSTAGGDLRAPHFIGMHGLQLLPLLGWVLSRRRRGDVAAARDPRGRLTMIAGLGFVGFTLVTLVEALRARPLFAPDALTMSLLIALVATVFAAVAVVLLRRRAAAQPLPLRAFGS